jgi:GT2 family glycosyltransferase
MAKIVAITVGYNNRRWLEECFTSLLASDMPGNSLDVIFVDNNSSDGSLELIRGKYPEVEVIHSPDNLGFSGANNIGMRIALERDADYVFLVNPDTRTPPDLVHGLTEFMESHPGYGVVGPMQFGYTVDGSSSAELNAWSVDALKAGEAHALFLDWPDHPSEAGPAEGRAPETLEHAYVQGAAFFCRAEVLRSVGLFDPAYHSFYEETDLCRRTRWGGWRVALLLNLGIQHYGGGDSAASLYRRRHMLRNKYYFLVTDPGWRVRDVVRLSASWVISDLCRRGGAPAATRRAAFGDVVCGMAWLTGHIPRMLARRRAHSLLRQRSSSEAVLGHHAGFERPLPPVGKARRENRSRPSGRGAEQEV